MPLGLATCCSPRDTTSFAPPSGSGTVVGPGSYVTNEQKMVEKAVCPFHTSTKRASMASRSVAPGPLYDVRTARSVEKASPNGRRTNAAAMGFGLSRSSFRFTGPRISPLNAPKTPGPGNYDVMVDRRLQSDVGDAFVSRESVRGVMPVLGTSLSTPSMPFKPMEAIGGSLPPADYDSIQRPIHVMRPTMRVVDFHTCQSGRGMSNVSIDYKWQDPNFPAPDRYDVTGEMTRGTTLAFRSKVPQSTDIKNDNPGPGTYPWQEKDEEGKPAAKLDLEENPTWGLRSEAIRTQPEWWADNSTLTPDNLTFPGPGTYSQPGSFNSGPFRRSRSTHDPMDGPRYLGVHTPQQIAHLRESQGANIPGFLSTQGKPCNTPILQMGVSPGEYNNTSSIGQSIESYLRERATIGRKGVFGSIEEKFQRGPMEPRLGPGPGTYAADKTEPVKQFPSAWQPGQSAFRNEETQRPIVKPGFSGQNPGQYYELHQPSDRKGFKEPKLEHVSFGLGHQRWDPREAFIGTLHSTVPGPGEYDPLRKRSTTGGVTKTTQSRSSMVTVNNPVGPGQYELKSTLIKQTFNAAAETHARRFQGTSSSLCGPSVSPGGAGGGAAASRARKTRHVAKSMSAAPPTRPQPSSPSLRSPALVEDSRNALASSVATPAEAVPANSSHATHTASVEPSLDKPLGVVAAEEAAVAAGLSQGDARTGVVALAADAPVGAICPSDGSGVAALVANAAADARTPEAEVVAKEPAQQDTIRPEDVPAELPASSDEANATIAA